MKQSTEWLVMFAKMLKPKRYLEIGVKRGETFWEVMRHCGESVGLEPDSKLYANLMKDKKDHPECIKLFENTSDEFFASEEADNKYDMIFIDGEHTAEQVEKDFNNSIQVLNYNGWIFIHDTQPPDKKHLQPTLCGDVWEFMFAEKRRMENNHHMLEIVNLPCQFGLTAIHMYQGQLDFMPYEEQFVKAVLNKKVTV
tara:strand:- start:2314 stop:2904 length:591 start_codon:yes stop_codon:yes gene_type:complete